MNNMVLSLAPKFTKLRVLTLRQDKPLLDDNAVKTIDNNCHDLEDLDLSKSFKLGDPFMLLDRGCLKLIKLNISGCSAFSDRALEFLSSYCRKLKILNLCGCVKTASDKALKAIGYNCRQLQSINLGWCEGVSDAGVMSLAYGCPDLHAIDLCGCVLITESGSQTTGRITDGEDGPSVEVRICDYNGEQSSDLHKETTPLTRHRTGAVPVTKLGRENESVIALANNCLHLRSLGLYYCQNITDRAMYALAHSRVKTKHELWESVKTRYEEEGLINLNISQCTALTPPAVQALCDSFPALHTCPGRHSLIISGCLNLTSVHCACAFQPHHAVTRLSRSAPV